MGPFTGWLMGRSSGSASATAGSICITTAADGTLEEPAYLRELGDSCARACRRQERLGVFHGDPRQSGGDRTCTGSSSGRDSIERLTQGEGSNTASMSPGGGYFVSNWSDIRNPGHTRLFASDGRLVRTLDSNPSYELKRLRFGPRERVKIPDQGWLHPRSRAGAAAGSGPGQEASGLVHDLRRAACADGF